MNPDELDAAFEAWRAQRAGTGVPPQGTGDLDVAFERWKADRERHARLAAVGLQREPTDSGVGGVGRAFLKATSALNPFQDEIAGVIEGVGRAIVPGGKGFREGYVEARDAARAPVHQFEEENPKTALALDVAGGLLAPLPGGKVTAVTKLGRAAQAAGRGAAAGAGYAFGAGEGSAGQQIATTALGAGLGGVTGAVAQPVAEFVGSRLAGRAGRANRRGADIVGQVAKMDDRTLADLPVPGPGQTVGEASDRVGSALARRVAGQGGGPADRLVAETAARAAEGPDMVFRAAAEALGQKPKDPNALIRTVRAAQREIGPEFEAVLDTPVQITPALKDLLTKNTHLVRHAFKRGRAIALERVGGTADQPKFAKPIQDYVRNKVVMSEVPLQTLKVIKEGLDDLARNPDAPRSLTRQQSGAAASRVSKIRDAVVAQVGEYGTALEKYAAQERNIEVLKLGLRGFGTTAKWQGRTIRLTPEEISRIHGTLEPEAQGYLAMGLTEAVRRKGTPSLSVEQMRVLRAVAPNGVAKLEEAMKQAGVRGQLAGEVAQSARHAATRTTPGGAQQGATEVAVGARRAGAQHIIRSLFERRDDPEVRKLLVDYLMSQGDNGALERLRSGAAANARTVRIGQRAGSAAGAAMGGAFR